MKTIQDADVRFLLKDTRATGSTLISLFYRYGNGRFVYSTGQTIEPYQWDVNTQRAYTNQKTRAGHEPFQTINAHLDRHTSALIQFVCHQCVFG